MPVEPKKLAAFLKVKGKGARLSPAAALKKAKAAKAESSEASEVDVAAVANQIKQGKGDPNLMRMAKGITPETNPPQWVADEETWEKAKEAVEPSWDKYDEPYAVVASVYQKMGGKFKGKK